MMMIIIIIYERSGAGGFSVSCSRHVTAKDAITATRRILSVTTPYTDTSGCLTATTTSMWRSHDKTTSVVRQTDERGGQRNCCRLISPPSADASIRPPRKARDVRGLLVGKEREKGGRGAAANSFFSLALCTWKTGSLGVTAFSRD